MKKTIPYTKAGYERLLKEYDGLQIKRKSAVEELSRARDMGDRSENAAYKSARQNLSRIDSRGRHLNRLIQYGYIFEPHNKDHAQMGCYVTIDNGKSQVTYELVGEYEADPLNGKLSVKSPIGLSLLRKKVGDTVSVAVPSGIISLKVINISWQ